MNLRDELLKIFSGSIRGILGQTQIDFNQVQEIRLRIHAPMLIIYKNEEYYVSKNGKLTRYLEEGYEISKQELRETMEYISNYSLYAFEEEMKQGFITIQGGHRIGLAGKTILDSSDIKSMKYIAFINIRLSHQIKGCATPVLPFLYEQGKMLHTLLISPPRCGKTTLLRDIIRQISNGTNQRTGKTVGVVDERSELAACYMGIPQNDLGIRTDVLDCCPKAKGMMMMIRTMSPEVIAVDEIGSREDLEAIEYVINCGCKLLATVHGHSIEDIKTKPVLRELLNAHVFERYILLNNIEKIGNISAIYDSMGNPLLQPKSRWKHA